MPANWRLLEAELIDALETQGARVKDRLGEHLWGGISLEAVSRHLADRVTLDTKAVAVKSQTDPAIAAMYRAAGLEPMP